MQQRLFDRMNNLQRDIKRWSCRIHSTKHAEKLARLKERADTLLEAIRNELGIAALEENLEYARNPYNSLWVDRKLVPHVEVSSEEVTE